MQSSTPFAERKPLKGDGKSPLGSATLGLTSKYSSVADDSSVAKETREAAALLTEAEGHLTGGQQDDALAAAEKALDIFRKLQDTAGMADALILIIDAKQMQADASGSKSSAAMHKAANEKEGFEESEDLRGAACMSMKHAELSARISKNSMQLDEAISEAEGAVSEFKNLADTKMEACAHLVVMAMYFMKQRAEDTLNAASEALKLFKGLGDKVGEAKALHGIALSYLIPEDFDNAIKYGKKAMALYQSLGDKRSVAFESQVLAMWYMAAERPQKALPLAKDALKIVRGLGVDKRTEAIALLMYCEALVGNQQGKRAVKEAQEGLALFRQSDDNVGIAAGLEVLLYTMLDSDTGDANEVADEVISFSGGLQDKLQEINLLHAAGIVKMKSGDYEGAIQVMADANATAREIGDKEEQADAMRMQSLIYLSMPDIQDDANTIKQATDAAEVALNLFKEEGYTNGEASTKMILACLESLGDNPDAVLQGAEEARELYKAAGNSLGESDAMYMMVRLFRDFGELDAAYNTADECVEMWSELGKKKAQADALYTRASLAVEMDRVEEAVEDGQLGLSLARKVGAKTLEASFCLLLAQVYVAGMSQEDLPHHPDDPLPETYLELKSRAMEVVKGALVLGSRSGDKGIRAAALFWRSEVLVWAFKGPEALESAIEAEAMFTKLEDAKSVAHTQILLADLLNIQGKKAEAREKAKEALEYAQSTPEGAEIEQPAQEVLKRIDPPKAKKGKKSKKTKKKKGGGGKKTQLVKKMVKKAGGGGGFELVPTQNKLIDLVKQVIAGDEEADNDTPFMEAGIDSLGSVQLVTDVGKEFRMSLAPSVVFDYPTVRSLADHLVAEAGGGGGGDEMVEEWVEEEIDGDDDDEDEDESEEESDDDDDGPRTVAVVAQSSGGDVVAEPEKPKGLDVLATRAKVIELVQQVIAGDEEDADNDTPFMEAGIDSLGSVQLVTDIGKQFRMSLAPSVVFDYPTARSLSDHLVAESMG